MKTKLILLLTLFYTFINAQNIDKKTAEKVAENFLFEKLSSNNKNITINKLSFYEHNFEDIEFSNKEKSFYILNFKDFNSFVIISANNKVNPILAYSLTSQFSSKNIPPALSDWLLSTNNQIIKAKNSKNIVSDKIKKLWEKYNTDNFKLSSNTEFSNKTTIKAVSELLSTSWNQGKYFNTLCPECSTGGSDGHVWAGCVATAYAQVMKYYNYPDYGEGEHSYTHSIYGYQYADFENTNYKWSEMPNYVSAYNDDIAQLLYHCGVAVNMNYSPSGSGASGSSARTAMVNYFKYSSNALYTSKYNYTDENWKKLIRNEIDNGKPMYYVGYGTGGHAFNCDGYDDSDYFHFNWGWGGAYNGYFLLDDLTPGGSDFTDSQSAVVGAVPKHLEEKFDSLSAVILTSSNPYNSTTSDGLNLANSYSGSYFHSTGKEKIHKISTAFSGRISAKLSNLNDNDLDVFILKYADRNACLANGDLNATLDNAEIGDYYIIVDGRYANEGEYTLEVSCPDEKADLIVEFPKIEPYLIMPGQTFQINSRVKNIGNSNAASNKLEYFLSEDNELSGDDISIGFSDVSALISKQEISISEFVNLPEGLTAGTKYIILKIDSENTVNETDEDLNTSSISFQIPETGIMDCSTAIELENNITFYGNTALNGTSNIDNYSCFWNLTNKEIIHSFTPEYSGIAELEFSETLEGQMFALLLSACNENTCINTFGIWEHGATSSINEFHVIGGITYYIVIDGNNDMGNSEGEYSIKVKFPEECPSPFIYPGDFDKCIGDADIYLSTHWAFPNFQWTKDNMLISNENNSYLRVNQTGLYSVKVTENNCIGESEKVQVRYNEKPSSTDISATDKTTICDGKNVNLQLSDDLGYSYQWFKNDDTIKNATNFNYFAFEEGSYKVKITNISCTAESNEIDINILESPEIYIGKDTSIYTNQSISLDAGIGFNSYLWNTEETTQTITFNGNIGSGNYSYYVKVTNDNMCENSDTILITVQNITDINEISFDKSIKLYPNPAKDNLTIEFVNKSKSVTYIEIYDISGNLIIQKEFKNSLQFFKEKINLQQLKSGTYMIRIKNSDNLILKKIILE
ncbi:MAG: C10 family peptidase [Bacteroidales bacterium]|nr:C10 family peptidase [Bacteroidales bacterium]MBN2758219.1 C10 family peptidase [Bacteroidales bacterium]